MKKLGIYNPVMFSCSRHRGGYVVNEAIKDLKFKYVRCTWGVYLENIRCCKNPPTVYRG